MAATLPAELWHFSPFCVDVKRGHRGFPFHNKAQFSQIKWLIPAITDQTQRLQNTIVPIHICRLFAAIRTSNHSFNKGLNFSISWRRNLWESLCGQPYTCEICRASVGEGSRQQAQRKASQGPSTTVCWKNAWVDKGLIVPIGAILSPRQRWSAKNNSHTIMQIFPLLLWEFTVKISQ